MSQARLPRTEPSTELITAHKVNHCAAHVAGRALGIFAKVRSHRGGFRASVCYNFELQLDAESWRRLNRRPWVATVLQPLW